MFKWYSPSEDELLTSWIWRLCARSPYVALMSLSVGDPNGPRSSGVLWWSLLHKKISCTTIWCYNHWNSHRAVTGSIVSVLLSPKPMRRDRPLPSTRTYSALVLCTRLGWIWIGQGPGNAGFLINCRVIGAMSNLYYPSHWGHGSPECWGKWLYDRSLS